MGIDHILDFTQTFLPGGYYTNWESSPKRAEPARAREGLKSAGEDGGASLKHLSHAHGKKNRWQVTPPAEGMHKRAQGSVARIDSSPGGQHVTTLVPLLPLPVS